ncbi:MAG: phosphodiester glycosidase family protein, partial [bacterium]|nr:phosphodiester glycosidase family protein [bacterium]
MQDLKNVVKQIILISSSIFLTLPSFGQEVIENPAYGIVYYEYFQTEGPKVIQVLKISRDQDNIGLDVTLGGDYILGIEPLNKTLERYNKQGRYPVAAVNGDFYMLRRDPFQGDPTGLCVINNEIVSSPVERSVFVQYNDGTIGIERFELKARIVDKDMQTYPVEGVNQKCSDHGIVALNSAFNAYSRAQKGSSQITAELKIGYLSPEGEFDLSVKEAMGNDTIIAIPENSLGFVGLGRGAEFLNDLAVGEDMRLEFDIEPGQGDILYAIGGTPRLIRNGKISIENEEEKVNLRFVEDRHPRTAIGYNDEFIFLITVDGRRPGHSIGMSLYELSEFMLELGCEEAMNLDGGGSTTMW